MGGDKEAAAADLGAGERSRHPLVRLGTSQPALASIIGACRSAMDHVFGPSSRGIEGTWQTCHKGERDENRAPLNGLTFALTMHGAQPSYQRR